MNVSFPNVRHTESRIAHNGGGDTRLRDSYAPPTTSMSWHTDSSANPPPPGLIFLYMLECPDIGGDTVSANTAEAYKILSRPCAERLQGSIAEHKVGTGVSSVLPVVRTHLVTGEKCLVVNPLCPSLSDQISFPVSHAENMVSLASDTTNIIGFKKEEKRHSAQVLLRASRLFPIMSGPGSSGPSEDTVVIFDVSVPLIPLHTLILPLHLGNHTRMQADYSSRTEPRRTRPSLTLSTYVPPPVFPSLFPTQE